MCPYFIYPKRNYLIFQTFKQRIVKEPSLTEMQNKNLIKKKQQSVCSVCFVLPLQKSLEINAFQCAKEKDVLSIADRRRYDLVVGFFVENKRFTRYNSKRKHFTTEDDTEAGKRKNQTYGIQLFLLITHSDPQKVLRCAHIHPHLHAT